MHTKLLKIVNSCITCKVPTCSKYCMLHLPINDIMKLLQEGSEEDAATLLYNNTVFPFVCGKLCDVNRKCYGHCVKSKMNGAVKFSSVEAYLGHKYIKKLFVVPPFTLNVKPAIIGGGITALAIAVRLINNGIRPTIYEKTSNLGGVLSNSLPDFRYDKTDYQKVIKFVEKHADVYYQKELGNNLFIEDLKGYDDVVIALGSSLARSSLNDEAVYQALNLLEDKNLREKIKNKSVIVLGGGNVAFDIARTMKKLENNVTIAYRRNLASAPASTDEINDTLNEQVKIKECVSPIEVIKKDNEILGLKVEQMELFDDGTGRLNFKKTGIYDTIKTDVIIEALGSTPDYNYLKKVYPNIFDDNGYIIAGDDCQTPINHLYVGGDFYTGAKDFNTALSSSEIISKVLLKKYYYNSKITNQRAVLGGSFNPPTKAHLEMIKTINRFNPSEIIILPNGDNYHLSYSDKTLDSFGERVKMCEEMIKDSKLQNCKVLKLENNHAFKGTYYTLNELNHPAFILGSDCLFDFPKWQHYEELVRDNYFIVFSRERNIKKMIDYLNSEKILANYKQNFMFINLKMSQISSTTFRQKLEKKMLSESVFDYIIKNNLYEVKK